MDIQQGVVRNKRGKEVNIADIALFVYKMIKDNPRTNKGRLKSQFESYLYNMDINVNAELLKMFNDIYTEERTSNIEEMNVGFEGIIDKHKEELQFIARRLLSEYPGNTKLMQAFKNKASELYGLDIQDVVVDERLSNLFNDERVRHGKRMDLVDYAGLVKMMAKISDYLDENDMEKEADLIDGMIIKFANISNEDDKIKQKLMEELGRLTEEIKNDISGKDVLSDVNNSMTKIAEDKGLIAKINRYKQILIMLGLTVLAAMVTPQAVMANQDILDRVLNTAQNQVEYQIDKKIYDAFTEKKKKSSAQMAEEAMTPEIYNAVGKQYGNNQMVDEISKLMYEKGWSDETIFQFLIFTDDPDSNFISIARYIYNISPAMQQSFAVHKQEGDKGYESYMEWLSGRADILQHFKPMIQDQLDKAKERSDINDKIVENFLTPNESKIVNAYNEYSNTMDFDRAVKELGRQMQPRLRKYFGFDGRGGEKDRRAQNEYDAWLARWFSDWLSERVDFEFKK